MFYIIGPRESAIARARKDGLRAGEWKLVDSRYGFGSQLRARDIVLQTHDAQHLPEFAGIMEEYRFCVQGGV